MKLAIISDLHLGKKMYRTEDGFINKFEKIGYDVFDKNIDIILAEKPDILIYGGDIFDVPNPSILALEKFRAGLARLKDIPSLIILGNHDFNFSNKNNECSSVNTMLSGNGKNILKFADYNVEHYIQDNVLFVLAPYVHDKDEAIENIWSQCRELVTQYPNYTKILITHGITEDYMSRFPEFKEKFVVPDSLVRCFDTVFIGHIHTPFEYTDENTLVVSPGGLIDYQAKESKTGVCIYDTDTKVLERKIVDTPHIIKRTVDEKSLNEILAHAGEYIYNLTFVGDISAIDNDLFTKAKARAVNLVLSLETEEKAEDTDSTNIEDKKHSTFFEWVAERYPDKIDIFKEAKGIA